MFTDNVCISCRSEDIRICGQIIQCLTCGLSFAKSESALDYEGEYSDPTSLYFDHARVLDLFQTTNAIDKYLLPFERKILDILRFKPAGGQLVDLGCGVGRFLRSAEQILPKSIGFEIAEPLVERLLSYGRTVIKGDINDFLEAGIRADIVTLLEVIEHLKNPGELIGAILKEKRPDLLIVVVPLSVMRRRFDKDFADNDIPPNHVSWWTERSLSRLLTKYGYKSEVTPIRETKRNIIRYLRKNGISATEAGPLEWCRAAIVPPPFWLLGVAEKLYE